LQFALDQGAEIVGYLDVDLSTPTDEVTRILAVMETPEIAVGLGARVVLLGTNIERSRSRQILGRIFATGASMVLGLRMHDTQCGAKFFRATPALRRALAAPFISRWVFDVELISRLLAEGVPPAALVEVPLRRWADVAGSKLSARWILRSGFD